jgi:miniconductance mechanosensitive channel
MEKSIGLLIRDYLIKIGVTPETAVFLKVVIVVVLILLVAYLANFLFKKIILAYVKRLIRKTDNEWDDLLIDKKVLHRLANFAPVLIIYFIVPKALVNFPQAVEYIQKGIEVILLVLALLVFDAIINVFHGMYQILPMAKEKSIKGYIQVLKIFLYFIGGILLLSLLLGESPLVFLGGLGALAAVLLLVFKDTILGFVASIQLSANNMVKIGDWIDMPSRGADGTVMEITLNTVKVQNWDKTISSFPTYALVSESFVNWRGMEESGGRRIKRAVYIDLKSVKFCTPKMLEKFRRIQLVHDYVEKKEKELKEYNESHGVDNSILVNGRRQTNLGVFRAYITEYLRRHPKINKDMTFLVRHLQPTDRGIPIEIFVFSTEKAWAVYESIQADIFDHILAVIPEFDLSVFQNPTGDDFRALALQRLPAASPPQKE